MTAARTSKIPVTYGIKYAGSKLRMLPEILAIALKTGARSVLDAFSGTTRVSQAFAAKGMTVTSNDAAAWSSVFARCYLKGETDPERYRKMIDHLNSLSPEDGWFTENYGGDPGNSRTGGKRPFQKHNTRKLDAIRPEIDRMGLSPVEKSVALTSLILALDKVDSTIGHFASYLREWSPRSYNRLLMEVPVITSSSSSHKVIEGDVFDAAATTDSDLAYLDPPYGSNNAKMPPSRVRYEAYYHLWKTVVLNDRPDLFGKARRRSDSADDVAASVFEEFRRDEDGQFISVKAIERLVRETRSRFVLLSYSSGGRATREALLGALEDSGRLVEAVEVDHRRNVMSGMHWTGEWRSVAVGPHKEYLFLLEK